jgi:hypothetical protein
MDDLDRDVKNRLTAKCRSADVHHAIEWLVDARP